MKGYLFDTNILIWYLSGDNRLKKAIIKHIEDPNIRKYISIASAWEIAIKMSLGKFFIDGGAGEFWRKFTEGGFEGLPISIETIEIVQNLPFHHKDPFDRIMIATAKEHGLEFITSDNELKKYFSKPLEVVEEAYRIKS